MAQSQKKETKSSNDVLILMRSEDQEDMHQRYLGLYVD